MSYLSISVEHLGCPTLGDSDLLPVVAFLLQVQRLLFYLLDGPVKVTACFWRNKSKFSKFKISLLSCRILMFNGSVIILWKCYSQVGTRDQFAGSCNTILATANMVFRFAILPKTTHAQNEFSCDMLNKLILASRHYTLLILLKKGSNLMNVLHNFKWP